MVDEGYLDARKSAQAIIGFDEALRFFIKKESHQLRDIDFEIPVRVNKGSWEVLIPKTIEEWLIAGGGTFLTTFVSTYAISAAKKMAENDFKNIGLREIFIKAFLGIQWFIKIGKHIGNLTQKKFEKMKWKNNNTEIGIPNSKNEYLYVPFYVYKIYLDANPKILEKIAQIIEDERELSILTTYNGFEISEHISINEKYIFAPSDEDEEIILPELVHGQLVELNGYTTRGNETANSIGFKYENHIITCYPVSGNIVKYKESLFVRCKIVGVIDRADEKGKITEKRPKIYFKELVPIENSQVPQRLF